MVRVLLFGAGWSRGDVRGYVPGTAHRGYVPGTAPRAGRAYVAWKSADKVTFDKNLTFNSSDGIPSVLRLRQFAQEFMGSR